MASTLRLLGNAHIAANRPDLAIGYYQRAEAIYETLYGKNNSDVVITCQKLGMAYTALLQPTLALESLTTALQAYAMAKIDDKKLLIDIHHTQGIAYKLLGQYDKSFEHLYEATQINATLNRSQNVQDAPLYALIGSVCLAAGRDTEAIEWSLKAEEKVRLASGTDQPSLKEIYTTLSQAYQRLGHQAEATAYEVKARAIQELSSHT